jgi:HTH-type transcriptional regulator, sugar sensing transcriptional regulator
MEDRFEEILAKVGLTTQESRTYLALLRMKESQTGALCKETGIASSNIYNVLDGLMKRGLVSYRLRNNVKIFMASEPEVLNELFVEREKKLGEERKEVGELIKNLKKPKKGSESYANYKYFEGISGVKAMWYEITDYLSLVDRGDVIKVYIQKKEAYEHMVGFYNEFHKERKKSGVGYQMILPLDDRALGEKRKKGDKSMEVKYADLKNEAGWGVIGEKFYILTTTGKLPVAFLINNKKIADTFKQVFDDAWKQAKS